MTPCGGRMRVRSSHNTLSGSRSSATGTSINRSTSCDARLKCGRSPCKAHDGVQEVTADEHRQRGEPSQHVDLRWEYPDLFVRLAEGSLFYRLTGIETPTWQRHLTGVVAQVRSAHRQREIPAVVVWIEQEKRRRRAQSVDVQCSLRSQARAWRHPELRIQTGQWGGQGGDATLRENESSFTLLSSRFSVLGGLTPGTGRPAAQRPIRRDQIDHPGPSPADCTRTPWG